jgi:hypothetical protein
MELAELLAYRPVPAAGILVMLTSRCPLRCAHCSTSSTMDGVDAEPGRLLRFVESLATAERPEVLMLTGGEPLLLPDLVVALAGAARRVGTRTALLTGAFFAAVDPPPAPLWRAIRAVDHLSVSIDAHHERQVRRADAFRLLHRVLDAGVAASVHTVGTGPDDPYLAELTAHAGREFGGRMPVLANTVRAVGRGTRVTGAAARRPVRPGGVLPCAMAAWPVITADGTVVACCNQDVVERRPVPAHLRLGHVGTDGWAAVRARLLDSPVLRAIRSTGPAYLQPSADYCGTCRTLTADALATADRLAAGPVGELLDRHAALVQVRAGPVAFVRRHGVARYGALVAPAGHGPIPGGPERTR